MDTSILSSIALLPFIGLVNYTYNPYNVLIKKEKEKEKENPYNV